MEENKSNNILKIIGKIVLVIVALQALTVVIAKLLGRKGKKREEDNEEREIKEYYAYLDGKKVEVDEEGFKGMIIKSFMGGVDIDLTQAQIANDSFISIDATMSGVSIKVPEHVNVNLDGKFRLSGFSNNVPEYLDPDIPTLYVVCKTLMSGIAVEMVVDEEDSERIFAE